MKAHLKPFGLLTALCLLLLVAAAPALQASLGQGGVTGGKSKGGTLRDQPTEAEAEPEAEAEAEAEEEEEEESDDSDEGDYSEESAEEESAEEYEDEGE